MNTNAPYLIDSNVFIEAKNRYYSFSICEGFWDSLVGYHKTGNIYSIDHIKEELLRGGDILTGWVENLPSGFFLSTQQNETVKKTLQEIMTWVQNNPQFFDAAKASFATEADGWLAAYAKVHGHTVVTGEQLRTDARNKVHLPNVCKQFNVQYRNIFEMLKDLKIRFVWKRDKKIK